MFHQTCAIAGLLPLFLSAPALAQTDHDHGSHGDAAPASSTPTSTTPAATTTSTSGTIGSGDDAPAAPRWNGSEVSLTHNVSVGTFDAGLNQTYNPTVTQGISIDPRWRWSDRIILIAHLGVETELTNSDTSTYEREPLLEDVFVQANYRLNKLPFLIGANAGLRLILPASKNSWAREMYFGIAPSFTINRDLEIGENFILQPFASVRTTFYATGSKSVILETPYILNCADCGEFDHAGGRTAWASFNETIGVNLALPYRLTGQVSVSWIQSLLYEPTDTEFDTQNDGPNTRYANIYVIDLGWDATKHIRVNGGFLTFNEQLAPDSTYYTPFFNRWTQVYLKGTYVF
jgi:hypothetical protein